ncbi:MAG: hypothetical protein FWH06_06295 [Oscillospiraceae bacterium]|nr:hypothetical protein [Oscillospiraceae bacterium]
MNVWTLRRRLALKVSLYALLALLTLLAQCTLPALAPWQVRPIPLLTLAALIAFFEGPRMGGVFGFACGALCDWLSAHTVTYYAVALMLFGVALGLLIEYSMRRNILSALFVSIVTIVPVQAVFFALFIWLPGRAPPYALVTVATPEALYTLALTPLLYFPAKAIRRHFEKNA